MNIPIPTQGFDIDKSPECCGYLQFADGSIEQTIGQTRVSWMFENGETTVETLEILENCIADVVLGEEVLYRHDIFNAHRSSLAYCKSNDAHIELAPFYYSKKHKITEQLLERSSGTVRGVTYTDVLALETKRQNQWDFETDFGHKASPEENAAEGLRRQQFHAQNPQPPTDGHIPRMTIPSAPQTAIQPDQVGAARSGRGRIKKWLSPKTR